MASFGAKEVAEIVSLLILVLIFIAKLREFIMTLRGRRVVAGRAVTGTNTDTGAGTGTNGEGDTGGNRMGVECNISVDNSISASVEASMTAGNGVDA